MDLAEIANIRFVLYSLFLCPLLYKIYKWLSKYLYRLKTYNKIKGLPIIPFIGNAHQLKKKHGINKKEIFVYFKISLKKFKT